MTWGRRDVLRALGASAILSAIATIPRWTAAAKPALDGRLRNRLDLWGHFVAKTETLSARYIVLRESALLHEPLSNGGTLAFIRPDRLVLRDDGPSGSVTVIEPTGAKMKALVPVPVPGWPAITETRNPGATWLAARLLALFGGPDDETLLDDTRPHVPRGRGYRFELLPLRNSAVRKALRGLTVRLDPVQGTILELDIAEAQGDVVRFEFSDIRQNLPPSELEPHFRLEDTGT